MLCDDGSNPRLVLLPHEERRVTLLKDEKAVVGRILMLFHDILDRFSLESGLEHIHLKDALDGMNFNPLI